jgi:hypothetical protein
MKHAVEISSCAMLYIPSFAKVYSGIQKLIGGIYRHTDNMVIYKPIFISQIRKVV